MNGYSRTASMAQSPLGVQRRDVLIVGAGIAGLLAGRILKKANYNVTILEANDNHIGGRIKTFQFGSFHDPRLYSEAGAMRIPTTHPLVNKLIAVVGLDKRTQGFFNVDVAPEDGDRKVFRT
jgi:monoamine oxidase